ncbi:MAG: exodeoxyribonuclease VII small subunit [Bacteroidales bacterium]|nr:exodeoxyribonuclease VII small subunit [Bacteroidales bacterium]
MTKNTDTSEISITAERLTYETAYAELEQIAEEIENEEVSVDILAEKVKRASELVAFCQTKLKATEEEVNKILAQMAGTSTTE